MQGRRFRLLDFFQPPTPRPEIHFTLLRNDGGTIYSEKGKKERKKSETIGENTPVVSTDDPSIRSSLVHVGLTWIERVNNRGGNMGWEPLLWRQVGWNLTCDQSTCYPVPCITLDPPPFYPCGCPACFTWRDHRVEFFQPLAGIRLSLRMRFLWFDYGVNGLIFRLN